MKRQLSSTQEIVRVVKPKLVRQNATVTPMILSRPRYRGRSLTNPPTIDTPEKKNRDYSLTDLAIVPTTFWTPVTLLNSIDQGTTSSQRVGRKVQLKSIQMRWAFGFDNNFSSRLLVVYDRDCNGVTPTMADILGPAAFPRMTAPMNLANTDRFVVLHDEIVNPAFGAGFTAGKFYKKINLPMLFTSTSLDVTSIREGGIFFMMGSTQNASPEPNIEFTSRIRYTDV